MRAWADVGLACNAKQGLKGCTSSQALCMLQEVDAWHLVGQLPGQIRTREEAISKPASSYPGSAWVLQQTEVSAGMPFSDAACCTHGRAIQFLSAILAGTSQTSAYGQSASCICSHIK